MRGAHTTPLMLQLHCQWAYPVLLNHVPHTHTHTHTHTQRHARSPSPSHTHPHAKRHARSYTPLYKHTQTHTHRSRGAEEHDVYQCLFTQQWFSSVFVSLPAVFVHIQCFVTREALHILL